jgi:hypothetical protein
MWWSIRVTTPSPTNSHPLSNQLYPKFPFNPLIFSNLVKTAPPREGIAFGAVEAVGTDPTEVTAHVGFKLPHNLVYPHKVIDYCELAVYQGDTFL